MPLADKIVTSIYALGSGKDEMLYGCIFEFDCCVELNRQQSRQPEALS